LAGPDTVIKHKTAVFLNKERVAARHDALKFPDGEFVLLACFSVR
jgi:hypothetical protein